jgi:DDE family transposase
MLRSPRNVRIAFNHAGLTHYGGSFFLHEFLRLLQMRRFLARHLHWRRRNSKYSLSQMVLALTWPIILGLDRVESASLLRLNGTFQFLTGLPSFPDPQTLRRFLLTAPHSFATEIGRINDRLLQFFTHLPEPRSRMILDLDSTVVTSFGHQEGAALGYNPLHRGKKSYQPLLCVEANSAHLWGASLRPGHTDPHSGTAELLRNCWSVLPAGIREVRARADAGFYEDGFLSQLENCSAQYAVVAKMYPPLKRMLPGLAYQPVNSQWEMGECLYGAQSWAEGRRHVIARRLIEAAEATPTLFTLGRYQYRGWATNMDLSPGGVQRFYDGRAVIEVRIRELRQDFALANIPTRAFAANALFLEIVRLAYNIVTAFQRICLPDDWQSFTLQTLRHKLFTLPGELIRPGNRPVLRFNSTPALEPLVRSIDKRLKKLSSLS